MECAGGMRWQRPAPSGDGRIRFNLNLDSEMEAIGAPGHAGTVGPAVRGAGPARRPGPAVQNKCQPRAGAAIVFIGHCVPVSRQREKRRRRPLAHHGNGRLFNPLLGL